MVTAAQWGGGGGERRGGESIVSARALDTGPARHRTLDPTARPVRQGDGLQLDGCSWTSFCRVSTPGRQANICLAIRGMTVKSTSAIRPREMADQLLAMDRGQKQTERNEKQKKSNHLQRGRPDRMTDQSLTRE